jgi:catechol 2,3-dioxygenase
MRGPCCTGGGEMPIQRVGHVVIKMRDLEAAKRFYRDILGMRITDEREGFGVFFRFHDYHHDIAVFKVNEDAESPRKNQVGLAHIALVADSFDTVKAMYQRLKAHNVPIVRTVDHGITQSVYFTDPEGNELEIYCEVPEKPWQNQKTIIMAEPIDFDAVTAE